MLATTPIFQIVCCCLMVQGILIQERHLTWQELLKEATYRSLIAHTNLSPSLEEKMETDRLVWEKIQGARFLRKLPEGEGVGVDNGVGEELPDRIKTGILVDMTSDGGGLEFRQTEQTWSQCEEDKCSTMLKRLLSVWKIQKIDSNDIWIRIQLPRNFASEDVYEYTPKSGLQKLNSQKWENLEIKASRRKDHYGGSQEKIRQGRQFATPDFARHKVLALASGYRNKPSGAHSTLNGPTSYIPQVIDILPPSKYHSNPWREGGTYYQVNPVSAVIAQYQQEPSYHGFLPSMGPAGLPHTSYVHPVQFGHVFRNYVAPAESKPYQPTTPRYFKPSTQFIHYSEPDPLYHGEDPNNSEVTTVVYPEEVFDYHSEKTSDPQPFLVFGQSEITTENTIQSTESSVNAIHSTESSGNVIQSTESSSNAILSTEGSFNAIRINEPKLDKDEKIVRIPGNKRNRNSQTKLNDRPTPAVPRASSVEAYDYAPLHAKWGEKIKVSIKNKTITKPTVKTKPRPYLKIFSRNNGSTTTTTTETITQTSEISAQTPQPTQIVYVTSALPSTTTTTTVATTTLPPSSTTVDTIKSINMRIDDIKTKTPEEIVNTLTNIGVVNSTRVEGYPEISHDSPVNSTRLLDQIQAAAQDQAVDSSNPISVVINRISHSYSYKTARGFKKDVKFVL